jgi:predicted RNA polymerase sigma factor
MHLPTGARSHRSTRLIRIQASPVVKLSRAVAIAVCDGPEQGLRLIHALVARGICGERAGLAATAECVEGSAPIEDCIGLGLE